MSDDRDNVRAAITFFDGHAGYYEKNQYHTARRTFVNARHEHIVTLLDTVSLPRDPTVLDAGCGPGHLVAEFASRYRRITAMDAAPRMLHLARANVEGRDNVTFNVGRIEQLPYADGTFDLVCSSGVIEYLPDCSAALREMHRVLRDDGVLIIPTTNALAPAHWLRPLLQPIARNATIARWFGVQPGDYQLWYHRIADFKTRLAAIGFSVDSERYFYLTLPRPLDRLFPKASRRLETALDRCMTTSVRHLAEGYIAIARKRPRSPGLR